MLLPSLPCRLVLPPAPRSPMEGCRTRLELFADSLQLLIDLMHVELLNTTLQQSSSLL